jgi:hypothetical protein
MNPFSAITGIILEPFGHLRSQEDEPKSTRNPIGFFLTNISNVIEETEPDFAPSIGEIVLFKNEKGLFVTGAYQGMWADLRPLRHEGDSRSENFEASPYHGDETIMAKVNHANRNEKNEWVIDFMFSYVSVTEILPYNDAAREYALLANQAHAKRVELDMAS